MTIEDYNDVLEQLSTCEISDAMDKLGIACKWLTKNLVSKRGAKFWGVADTVMWSPTRKGQNIRAPSPSTWEEVASFISGIEKRNGQQVYVAGCRQISTDFALVGGLSLNYFEMNKYSAALMFGAVRDIDELDQLTFPIWYSNVSPLDSQGCMVVTERKTGCYFNGHFVNQGDVIFGDRNGAVALPPDSLGVIVETALGIHMVESLMMEKVRAGADLYMLIAEGGHI